MRILMASLLVLGASGAWTPVSAAGQASGPAVNAPDVTSQMLVSKLTRGIRPARTQGTATSAATVTPAPATESDTAPSVDLSVPFATGSAVIGPDAVPVITALGQALADPKLKTDRFLIEGHTDTVGAPAANQALSDRRARAVAGYLIAHFDIAPGRLQPKGVGEADLAVPTPPQTAEAKNRRVKVVNLGG